MLWFCTLLSELLLVLGGFRTYVWLRQYRFKPTKVRITRSEPVLIEEDENGLMGRYYPAIEFSYEAESRQRKGSQYQSPWYSSYDFEKVSSLCEAYRVTNEYPGWFDPRYPSLVKLERKVDDRGLLYLALAAFILLWCYTQYELLPQTILLLVLIALALLFLILSIEESFRDLAEITRITDPELRECRSSEVKGLDRKFLNEQLEELRALGFTPVVEIQSHVYRRYGFANYMSLLISSDRRTLASIGHIWYTRRIVGVFPLPFLTMKSLDFDSRFSNNTLLMTSKMGRLDEQRPPEFRRHKAPDDATPAEMFSLHQAELERIQAEDRLTTEEFGSARECIEYVHASLMRVVEFQSKQAQH